MTRRGDFSYVLSEDTILDLLYHVRAQAIRDRRWKVKCHVDALITARGHDPADSYFPRKQERKFKAGALRRLLIEALRAGPRSLGDMVEHVLSSRPDLPYDDARRRVRIGLSNMRRQGAVGREGNFYRLYLPFDRP